MANLSSYLPGGIDPSAVTITGGTINGTTIGASTAAAGTFTTFTSTGIDDNATSTAITIGSDEDVTFTGGVKLDGRNASIGLKLDLAGGDDYVIKESSSNDVMQFGASAGTAFYHNISSGNVGIGTTSPSDKLHVYGGSSGGTAAHSYTQLHVEHSTHAAIQLSTPNNAESTIFFGDPQDNDIGAIGYYHASDFLYFRSNSNERMRIDSSGSLLVGQTSGDSADTGHIFNNAGTAFHIRNGGVALVVDRKTSDGEMALFRKDGTTIGKITTRSAQFAIGKAGTGIEFNDSNDAVIPFSPNANNTRDNALDLGTSSVRWDDIYATNDVINTSDRNEKQDIEELTEAETRVAVAAKALLRKFRWKSAVRTKSHDARIHFGIIAQDLQAAFETEGLDAGDYGMFTHSTWTDEETGEERSRMGVRYSELLAFIIAAI